VGPFDVGHAGPLPAAGIPLEPFALTQIPKLGNRPRPVVLVLDLLGFCADERADLPGNYFVPFV
jgi:hypothetical protein